MIAIISDCKVEQRFVFELVSAIGVGTAGFEIRVRVTEKSFAVDIVSEFRAQERFIGAPCSIHTSQKTHVTFEHKGSPRRIKCTPNQSSFGHVHTTAHQKIISTG